jgi:CubicO group peptidase (beta-lactamase class C family)
MWEAGFGLANARAGEPMTASTRGRVGSISKVYTAIAALQLVEAGLLDLEQPVNQILEGRLDVTNPHGDREVTPLDLLTHRSGLAVDTVEGRSGVPEPLDVALRRIFREDRRREYHTGASRWTAKVGERLQYSSLGVAVLGLVVESRLASGESIAEFIQRATLDPLGLASTHFAGPGATTHATADGGLLSIGYARFGRTCVPTPSVASSLYPSVGLVSTPGDHVRVLAELLRAGTHGGRLLGAETVAQMTAPCVSTGRQAPDRWPGVPTAIGLGLELTEGADGVESFGHLGAYPWGWWNAGVAFPRFGVAVAAFCNVWDMTRWHNRLDQSAPGLVLRYVSDALEQSTRARARLRSEPSWDWKRSYAAGALLAERLRGALGIEAVISDEDVARMTAGAVGMAPRLEDLDIAAFADGVRSMNGGAVTPSSIREWMTANGELERQDLPLLALELGRAGPFPSPLRAFSEAG